MIRVTHCTSAGAAKSYYSTADYLAEGQELAGRVGGRLAAPLGLGDRITKEQFDRLCENLHPISAERLTQRTTADHQPGTDLTFTLAKGADAIRTLLRHDGIERAFSDAVDWTMETMVEPSALTRVRIGKRDEERVTGNMLWTSWDHFTARPVDGVPDFNRHRHVFVHNVTWDETEGRYKALQRRDLKAKAPLTEAAYLATLAASLRQQGFELERVGTRYFDIAGVPESVKQKFSRRTDQIEAEAEARGITDADEKGSLGKKTREKKAAGMSMDQLQARWLNRLTPKERAELEAVSRQAELRRHEGQPAEVDGEHARQAVAHALDHCLHRMSVVTQDEVLEEALRYGLGYVTPKGIRQALDERDDVLKKEIDGQTMLTTLAALEEERAVIAHASEGRAMLRPIGGEDRAITDKRLDDSQRAAVQHVLRSPDRVTAIIGKAGSGKTTALKELETAINEQNLRLVALAPTGESAKVLGESFEQARTLQGFLLDEKAIEQAKGQLWMLDEAGMVGMPLMRRFLDTAQESGARVLIVGDLAQHAPVERGLPLGVMQTYGGLAPAEIKSIKRQQTAEYRAAAQTLADGDTLAAFDKLDELGWIHELPEEERHTQIAKDYADAIGPKTGLKPSDALVIAPSHREGDTLTARIRAELQGRGQLGQSRTFTRLEPLHLTTAQQRDVREYKQGRVAYFHQHAKGFKAGTLVDIIPPAAATIESPTDQPPHLQPLMTQPDRWSMYQRKDISVAAGDIIRITARAKTEQGGQITNGSIHTVAGFTDSGGIRLADGRTLAADFQHFTHGYVLTSHASQSKTVQRTFVAIGPESYPAASKREFYVDASRSRFRVDVYAEKKDELRARIAADQPRPAASELAPEEPAKESPLAARAAQIRREERQARREARRLDIARKQAEERQGRSQTQ